MIDRPEYQQEERAALERRFRILCGVFLAGRERIPLCTLPGCRACELLDGSVPIPPSIAERAHEPREDLEQACQLVAGRLLDIARAADSQACPGGTYVREFYDRCEQALQAEHDGA